jgi:hypothetical protein
VPLSFLKLAICNNGLYSEERKMSAHVIEGTWEEIERHKAEFAGHMLRLTIKPQRATRLKPSASSAPTQPKKLVGYGAFKGMFGGAEAIIAEKQAQIELEERKCPHE